MSLDVLGSDPVVPQQNRKVSDIGGAHWLPHQPVTCCARRVFGQSDYLLLGRLASLNLSDDIGHRHFPAVGSVLLAPVRRGGDGGALHSPLVGGGGGVAMHSQLVVGVGGESARVGVDPSGPYDRRRGGGGRQQSD